MKEGRKPLSFYSNLFLNTPNAPSTCIFYFPKSMLCINYYNLIPPLLPLAI